MITHPSVHLIALVPTQRFSNTNPDYWTGGARHKTSAKKQDINIFVVCNDAVGRPHYTWKDGAMQDLNALGPRLQLDLLRDWPKLALDRELWRGVASRC